MAYTPTTWVDRAVQYAKRYYLQNISGNEKQMLPPFGVWTLHANAVVTSDYVLTLTATATNQNSSVDIPVIGGQTYTLSSGNTVNASQYWVLRKTRADGTTYADITFNSGTSKTITLENDVTILKVITVNVGSGTFVYTDPQLELSTTATSFVAMKTCNITQAPGIVTQAGTPLNAANLNTIETGLDTVHDTVDTHVATQTAVHGSTSAATANKLIHRDANGRAKVAAPSASDDIAIKQTVDDAITTHNGVTNPHSATSANTASRLVLRDANARAQFADPSAAQDAATKAYVDGQFSLATNGYQKLASGVIIQWGRLSVPNGTQQSETFPIAFPTACQSVQLTVEDSGTSPYVSWLTGRTASGFSCRHDVSTTRDVNWIAIGY